MASGLVATFLQRYSLIYLFAYLFIFKDFIYFQTGEGKERGRETSMCGCLSCAAYWGPGPKPRHVS